MRCLATLFALALLATLPVGAVEISDTFEVGDPGLTWSNPLGVSQVVTASGEARLQGIPLPVSGERVLRVAEDGDTGGIHLALTGFPAQDMTAEAWVFCEGNDGPTPAGGYQALLARASYEGSQSFIRLAWDPDHSEAGDTGDGWVKLQAYDGTTWDYLGIDFSAFGATSDGYIVNGTGWPSGWHLFRLEVVGDQVSAYVDDMGTPVVTGTLSVTLRDGGAGFYVYTSGDDAGYFDNFAADLTEPPPTDFDVLILNGDVYPDGDSGPLAVDIGIIDDRIASMESDLSGFTAGEVIDASGLLVVPGFIDAHTHADGGGTQSAYLRQGVTTLVTGNCGGSPSIGDVGGYYDSLAGHLGPNHMGLIGHNSLRASVGLSGSEPTPAQMSAMIDRIDEGMEAGAFGMSTGLVYATGYNSSTEEIIGLASAVAAHGGLYATHMRSESEDVLEAVEEAIRIGREAGCRVEISHAKVAGPAVWGQSDDYLALIDQANAEGVRVRFDQYPYTASQTTINVLIPDWAESNWSDAVANHRGELEADIRDLIAERGGADRVFFISGPFAWQWLSDVAVNLSKDPEDVLIDDVGLGGASAVYHTMQESDVQTFMQSPWQMVGSDGPTGGHPRGAGTFPRFWGHYGRDLAMFTVRQLVSKTSTMAAEQFFLLEQERGALREGWFADIAVIDWDTIEGRSTYEQPTLTPLGVEWVLVNGVIATEGDVIRSASNGRVLRLTDSFPEGTPVGSWMGWY
ncbi:amidohydrolase family protein [Candidatus Sumerlaeota bacterium]|nr:amidohydrolase family protein [Candidatus Sumerlaeota bacterium]